MPSSIPSGIRDFDHKPENLTKAKVTSVSQAAEASVTPKTTTAIEDSPATPSRSTRLSNDPQLLLVKVLARDLGKLLANSPEPDVYRTLNRIFVVWHKRTKIYDDLRDKLEAVYKDAGVPFKPLAECLNKVKGMNKRKKCDCQEGKGAAESLERGLQATDIAFGRSDFLSMTGTLPSSPASMNATISEL
ncbi:MAG: hypothetical protein L6R42_001742 [Xanthoria sp. 1 TBL-2021]|nr:MAG: hypothetical protein L6R42_001742 [Xanthoria sp. 1 TBL-2021]